MEKDDSVNPAFTMIPADMITEILCRLPSESVCRFRCVSKSWLCLLTQPEFIKIHHRNNRTKHHMYVELDRSTISYLLYSHPPFDYDDDDDHPFYHIIYPTDKLPFEFTADASMLFRGSCDGLVLVSQGMGMHPYETLTIINPTTRESVQLPQCGYNYPLNVGTLRFITHGFGYDSVTDDYKVVTLAFFGYQYQNTDLVNQTFVYSLRSNTWKQLFIDNPYDIRDWSNAVYLDGFLLWKGRYKDFSHLIVAFSLVDESFSQVPVPNLSDVTKTLLTYCRLVVLGGKLAMYMYSRDFKFEIWLMNEYGVKESWTKIPLDDMFDNNVFPERDYRVFDDDGKMWVVDNGKMRIYDFEKTTFIKHVYWKSSRFYLFATYVENLLSLKRKDTTHAEQILDISPERQNSEVALPKNLNPIYHPFCNKFLRLAQILNDKRASLRKKRKQGKAEVKDKRKKVKKSKRNPS